MIPAIMLWPSLVVMAAIFSLIVFDILRPDLKLRENRPYLFSLGLATLAVAIIDVIEFFILQSGLRWVKLLFAAFWAFYSMVNFALWRSKDKVQSQPDKE